MTAVADAVVADSTGYESGSAITIEKSAVDPEVVTGGTATFTISVRNTGTTDLTDVIVDDPGYSQCDVTYTFLPVGEQRTSSCSVTDVTADFTNAVDVTATDTLDETLTDDSSADVTVLVPSFTVAKTPDGETVTLNDDIDFTVRIENTGDTELVDVVIDDPLVNVRSDNHCISRDRRDRRRHLHHIDSDCRLHEHRRGQRRRSDRRDPHRVGQRPGVRRVA